jgi:hypothetical protein
MTPQERGHKGITHGMSPQERGRRGAEARWKKAHEAGGEVEHAEPSASETHSGPESHGAVGKQPSHGMSPHDRGVLGAKARWAKAHPEAPGGPESGSQRGG